MADNADQKTAPSGSKSVAKKGWKVLSPVSHDGVTYAPGETLPADAITEVQVSALTARGVIGAA